MSASMWTSTRTKPVFVVLTPSVAAIGSPGGVPTAPRVEETPPAPPGKPPPTELPTREAPRDLPARDLPSRELRQRNSVGLPARRLPHRAAAPTRAPPRARRAAPYRGGAAPDRHHDADDGAADADPARGRGRAPVAAARAARRRLGDGDRIGSPHAERLRFSVRLVHPADP